MVSSPTTLARFIEPMLPTPARMLPEGKDWTYELKLDGYRALAIKSDGRVQLRSRGLESRECPFANLPEAHSGRWGEGLTAEKMLECRWLRPVLVAELEFVEWTADNHLRHVSFVQLRTGKDPRDIRRES